MRLAKFSTKKIQKTIDATVDSVEIDLDFTQMYDCFLLLALGIKSVNSFQVLFFLSRITGRDNIVVVGQKALKEFNTHRQSVGLKDLSKQSFYNAINGLVSAGVMKKLPQNRGTYFLNPFAMWKADKKERIAYIKEDAGPGQSFAMNPINLLLNDADHEYRLETIQDDLTDADIEQMDRETEE